MKMLSFLTLTALLSLSACSHHYKKACCSDKAKAATCTDGSCKKTSCDQEKKCADGSCTKKDAKACEGESCQKKKS